LRRDFDRFDDMCGRFSLSQSGETIAALLQLSEVPEVAPRYNIAPTQAAPTVLVRSQNSHQDSHRQFQNLYWGLIPSWAKDPKMGARMINARAETVAEKPSFRTALKRRRCLVLSDGFYEWQRREKKKQPFYFQVGQHQLFAFAGLWEHWESAEGDTIDSCTILTTEPNALLRSFHDRMPVILKPEDYDLWLDPTVQKPELLQPLLCPYDAELMSSYPVSLEVNNPRHDRPDCIEPISA
jgi:putative SOS response-associated peptidase YedK